MSNAEPRAAAEVRHAHVAGALLIVTAILEVAAMAHHPVVHSREVAVIVAELERMSGLTGAVHGTLMALMLAGLYCLTQHCLQRGLRRPLVRAGLIGYATGILAMLGAATISGFVIVDMAPHLGHATPAEQQASMQLLALCHMLNRTLAEIGTVALSAGIVSWSVELLRDRGWGLLVGVLGCVTGLLPIVGLALGLLRLDVFGMSVVVLLQMCWSIGMGVLIYRSGRSGS